MADEQSRELHACNVANSEEFWVSESLSLVINPHVEGTNWEHMTLWRRNKEGGKTVFQLPRQVALKLIRLGNGSEKFGIVIRYEHEDGDTEDITVKKETIVGDPEPRVTLKYAKLKGTSENPSDLSIRGQFRKPSERLDPLDVNAAEKITLSEAEFGRLLSELKNKITPYGIQKDGNSLIFSNSIGREIKIPTGIVHRIKGAIAHATQGRLIDELRGRLTGKPPGEIRIIDDGIEYTASIMGKDEVTHKPEIINLSCGKLNFSSRGKPAIHIYPNGQHNFMYQEPTSTLSIPVDEFSTLVAGVGI